MAIIIASALVGVVILVLQFKQSMKLAEAFGKGKGYGVFLFFFDRLGRVILGLGSAEYVGKPEHRERISGCRLAV